ncbi:aldehyde-activating protein [Litorilituus sediminis]|uniref:Aldehyde-activating protein n=1 Tax=Litorilituus sediminis TaxID=718192 RepID=A0A4P6P403_9GAMM|nr:aldehyde-activating protein [Litorilituus sediminis]QBG36034.1 aldehyde-activating protein [Litorilituus sediminis]
MVKASCHCGNIEIEIEIAEQPQALVSCNCSICNKIGALWGHMSPKVVSVTEKEQASKSYSWGDKDLAFHHCTLCGCTTHYMPTDASSDRMAVNYRMVDRNVVDAMHIKNFDGADTWKFISE